MYNRLRIGTVMTAYVALEKKKKGSLASVVWLPLHIKQVWFSKLPGHTKQYDNVDILKAGLLPSSLTSEKDRRIIRRKIIIRRRLLTKTSAPCDDVYLLNRYLCIFTFPKISTRYPFCFSIVVDLNSWARLEPDILKWDAYSPAESQFMPTQPIKHELKQKRIRYLRVVHDSFRVLTLTDK